MQRVAKLSISVWLSDEVQSEAGNGVEGKTEEGRGAEVLKRQEMEEKKLQKRAECAKASERVSLPPIV